MPANTFLFREETLISSADYVASCFHDAPAKLPNAHNAQMTRLQPALSWSPQYVRAWRKYVEQDPAYRDAWVSPRELQAPEKLYFSLIHWRLVHAPTLPKLSKDDAKYVFSLPQILEAHLKLRGLDRDSRATHVNDFYSTQPTFDEASLTVKHLITVIETSMSGVVGIIHPEHDMQLRDEFTLVELWSAWRLEHTSESFADASKWAFRLINGLAYWLRPIYVPKHQMVGNSAKRVPPVSSPTLNSSIGCTLQYVTAWHKYALLDPSFAQLPISTDQLPFEELFFSTVHLRRDGFSSQIALLPGTTHYSFDISRVFHEYIFPRNGQHHLDVHARANRINALWRTRPELDESCLTVRDLISACSGLLSQQILAIMHPTQLLCFPPALKLQDLSNACHFGSETAPRSEPTPMCMPRLRFVLGSEMNLRDVEKVAIDSMGSVTSESSQLDLLAPSPYPALSSTSKSLLAMEDSPVQMRQRLVH